MGVLNILFIYNMYTFCATAENIFYCLTAIVFCHNVYSQNTHTHTDDRTKSLVRQHRAGVIQLFVNLKVTYPVISRNYRHNHRQTYVVN